MKKHTSTLRKRLLYCDTPHALAIYWMLIVFHSRRSLYLKLQNRRFYPSFSEINFNRSILTSPQARCRECSTTTKWGYKRCKRSTLEFMTFPTDQSLRIPAAFYSLQKKHTYTLETVVTGRVGNVSFKLPLEKPRQPVQCVCGALAI